MGLTSGDHIDFLAILDDGGYRPLCEHHSEVRVAKRLMLNDVLHYLLPRSRVESQWYIMV